MKEKPKCPVAPVNLRVMIRAVVKAARNLVRDFGEVEQLQVSMKGPADFVSAADRKAERIIVEGIAAHAARIRLPP
ncbi:MAG: hypothetical protein R3D03_14310 [Geminicoccaceae bacterium]